MLTLILWAQAHAPTEGFSWWGDQIRTVLMTCITGLVAFTARMLWCLRDDMRDVKRDLHGVDGNNGIKSDVRLLVQRVDVLDDWMKANEAVAKYEQEHYHGPDRRAGPRRIGEVVDEGHRERFRRATDEYPIDGE
jgi:hypothetical protein